MPEDELELDLSKLGFSKDKIIHFFKKYAVFFLVLIPVLLSIYIRTIPADLPITDDWAKSTVTNYYQNQIRSQIRQQYPNLPDQNINNLVEQQYAASLKENKAMISQQIKDTSQQFKTHFQDENGYTYMPDIDPYYWLRFSRNYLDHGYVGDEIRDGIQWDNHMVAPIGRGASLNPISIVLAYQYKITKWFNSKITLMQSASYNPVIIAALSIIPIFFIARMFSGNVGGFFAALMLAVNGAFLGRTSWGHPDTDPYNIVFALYFVWFFFLALKEKTLKKQAIYAAAGGFILGVFSLFWPGWWYIFDFMLATIGVYALYLIFFEVKKYSWHELKQNEIVRSFVMSSLLLIIISGIFVSLFSSPVSFARSVVRPIEFSTIKEASKVDLWPNVYTTVAELNSASFSTIINYIGGDLFFYLSLLGILLLLFTKTENKREHIPFALLIIFWYIGIFYASTKGIRFTMMLVPPLSLAIGAAIGMIYKKGSQYMEKMNISMKITKSVILIIFLLIFLPQIKGAADATKNDVPIMNDAWYSSLDKIRLESQPNAIVNSWWDFGHHFKYVADRAVTFDGASQNSPMAHWVGRVLLTSNEKEAIGILRMLDCGSNTAFEALDRVVNDTPTTVKMLYDIIVLDKSSASSYLRNKNIDEKTINEVLEKTHCNPPEDYFITSEDMVGKGSVWAHFGSWDFNKADIWINGKNLPREDAIRLIEKKFSVSEDEAKKIYFEVKGIANENDANAWIAPWPGYGGDPQGCAKQDNKLDCGGVLIDLDTRDVQINTDKGAQKPFSLVYSEDNNIIEKKFENGISQSILLLKDNSIMLSSPQVATSMFTKLFFYDGIGTAHFEKFSDETSIVGNHIIVWKLKW